MNLTGQPIYQKGRKPAKVAAIRNAARDMQCTLKIPGVCCHDDARTVGCHIRMFGIAGMGGKPDDLFILDACDRCHAVLDRRSDWTRYGLTEGDVFMAFVFTLRNRRAAGLIMLKGETE